jgi:hypothetical protein
MLPDLTPRVVLAERFSRMRHSPCYSDAASSTSLNISQ